MSLRAGAQFNSENSGGFSQKQHTSQEEVIDEQKLLRERNVFGTMSVTHEKPDLKSAPINFMSTGQAASADGAGSKFDTGSSVKMSAEKIVNPKTTTTQPQKSFNPYSNENIANKIKSGAMPVAFGVNAISANKINTGTKMRADFSGNYARSANPFNPQNDLVETRRNKFKLIDMDA